MSPTFHAIEKSARIQNSNIPEDRVVFWLRRTNQEVERWIGRDTSGRRPGRLPRLSATKLSMTLFANKYDACIELF